MRETNGEPRIISSSTPIPPIEPQAHQLFKMPASTSTVTTSDIPKSEKTARLRSSPDAETAPPLEVKEYDFFWTYTEEPHRTRRMAIIKAHPEVTKLCGPEPLTKYLVLLVVSIQILAAYSLQNTPFWSLRFWGTAYIIGATANQNLFLAIHEISHNLAFRKAEWNRALAVFANLPIGIPYSASFRPYHLTHHKSLGVDGLDTDLPTAFEAVFLDSLLGKAFFCTFQILFYAIRPVFVYKVPFTSIHFANIFAQLVFDYVLVRYTSLHSLYYLILSSFLAGSLHPCAGHFIAEHYIFTPLPASAKDPLTNTTIPETFSYYGILNYLTYNVGLHNEHHDFPAVPWSRLWEVNRVANEFYKDLPRHRSWVGVIWSFVVDEKVGMTCRVKRKEGGRIVGSGSKWSQAEVEA